SKSFASHSYEKYGVWGYSSQFGTQIVKTLEGTKMNKLLMALAAMGMVFAAQERKPEIPLPEVPESLQAPAGEKVILVGHATGVQIYECKMGANPPWALKGPEADLTDSSGKKIIHHFAGPTWQHIDGSSVVGKKIKEEPSKTGAIPWLLL